MSAQFWHGLVTYKMKMKYAKSYTKINTETQTSKSSDIININCKVSWIMSLRRYTVINHNRHV